jgi:hypothetical protein
MTKDVMTEAVWFANRSESGARFVFDDYKKYKWHYCTSIRCCMILKLIERVKINVY